MFNDAGAGASRGPGRGSQGSTRGPMPGEDALYKMSVEFRDSILGAEKEITLPNGKHLRVKIPPGILSGQKLRFPKQGSPSPNGGASGDAYVEIEVQPSSLFQREGKNLITELSVSLSEAILGAEIKAPTVDGTGTLRIPAGVNSGSKLRIRGKGVPGKKGEDPGDLITVLKIVLPEVIDPELRTFIEAWSKTHPHDPRGSAKASQNAGSTKGETHAA